jgi:hypothetical protein
VPVGYRDDQIGRVLREEVRQVGREHPRLRSGRTKSIASETAKYTMSNRTG